MLDSASLKVVSNIDLFKKKFAEFLRACLERGLITKTIQ
jgi:hypothetical protein